MTIGNIVVTLTGDAEQFFSTVDKVQLVSNALGSFLGTTFAGLAESFASSLLGAVEAAIKTAAAMEVTSEKTRLSVEQLSAMRYQADETGLSFKTVSSDLERMTEGIITQNAKQLEAFGQLGVKVQDTAGKLRPMKDVITDLSGAFAKSTDLSVKNSATLTSGQNDFIRLLNQGGGAMDDYSKKAAAAGEVMTTQTARAALDLQNNVTKLKDATGLLGGEILEAVVPVLATFSDELIQLKIQSAAGGSDLSLLREICRDLAQDLVILGTGALQTASILGAVGKTIKYFVAQEGRSGKELSEIWTPTINRLHDLEDGMLSLNSRLDQNAPRMSRATEEHDRLKKAADEAANKLKHLIESLELQAATLGMTSAQSEIYRAKQLNAGDADLKHVQILASKIEKFQSLLSIHKMIDQNQAAQANATSAFLKTLEDETTALSTTAEQRQKDNVAILVGGPLVKEYANQRIMLNRVLKEGINLGVGGKGFIEFIDGLEAQRVALVNNQIAARDWSEEVGSSTERIHEHFVALQNDNFQDLWDKLTEKHIEFQAVLDGSKLKMQGLSAAMLDNKVLSGQLTQARADELKVLLAYDEALALQVEGMQKAKAAQAEFARALLGDIEQATINFQGFGNLLTSLTKQLESFFLKMIVLQPLEDLLSGKKGSTGGVIGSVLGFLHIPGFAAGGDFSGGQPFIAGESGPELIMPRSSGSVIPNSALGRSGGGGNTSIYIDARGGISPESEARILSLVRQMQADGTMQTIGIIREMQFRRA